MTSRHYLQARDDATGNLPHYLVMIREGNEEDVDYFLGNEQLAAFAQENQDLHLFGKPEAIRSSNCATACDARSTPAAPVSSRSTKPMA